MTKRARKKKKRPAKPSRAIGRPIITVDTPLTDRQQRFVAEFLIDLNATQAIMRALPGSRASSATSRGSQLLALPNVALAIAAGKNAQLAKCDLSATRILEEARRIALHDPRTFYDQHGNLKPVHLLSEESAAALASMEIIKKNVTSGDGFVDTIHKVKTWPKVDALKLLFEHLGLLEQRIKVVGDIEYRWRTE